MDDKYGASHWYPDKGRYDFIDPETGEILTNAEIKKVMRPESHTYQKLVHICAYVTNDPGKHPYKLSLQKCKRKVVGRVLCEFESTPVIRIKGLCSKSPIDRDFQLIDPTIGEGKINNLFNMHI